MSAIVNPASAVAAPLGLVNLTPATVPLTVQAAASQSTDLQQWQSSTGSVLAKVDASGNVGIGTSSPQAQLHAMAAGGINRGILSAQHSTDAASALINFRKSRGSEASPTAVAGSDFIGVFFANPYDGSSYIQPSSFGFLVNGSVAVGSVPTDFYIATGNTGDASVSNKRLYVKSNGTVGIGLAVTAPAGQLEVRAGAATTIGQVIRAAASQAADILQIQSSTSAVLARVDSSGAIAPQNGARITSGSGVPTTPGGINPTAGDVYHRKDTPGVAMQNIYKCTVGGATPTWVALV